MPPATTSSASPARISAAASIIAFSPEPQTRLMAVALVVSMANLFYRDVKYLFEVVITVWMFATSVIYPIERVGGTIGRVLRFNPMTPIVDAYRSVLLTGHHPSPDLAYSAVVSVVLLALAWLVFHRSEFRFAESI